MFNPLPRIETIPITGRHACHVIDDALLDPDRWVELAAHHADAFAVAGHNAYPGPEVRMPDAISARLDAFFLRHVAARLGAGRTLRMYSRLSMVTRAPHELEPRQWICHRDQMGVPADQCVAASVLYLFRDPAFGGTSFFAPRRPEADIARLVHDSGTHDGAAFAARYGIGPGYLTRSNAWFEKVCTIAPRFNRLIFYDGSLFHCSDVPVPERLSADPRRGRLTLNGFFTCERAVAA